VLKFETQEPAYVHLVTEHILHIVVFWFETWCLVGRY
jgi:hypothetical protein